MQNVSECLYLLYALFDLFIDTLINEHGPIRVKMNHLPNVHVRSHFVWKLLSTHTQQTDCITWTTKWSVIIWLMFARGSGIISSNPLCLTSLRLASIICWSHHLLIIVRSPTAHTTNLRNIVEPLVGPEIQSTYTQQYTTNCHSWLS